MKIKFLFLLIYPIIFLSYFNTFAIIEKSPAAMLYDALLEDCMATPSNLLQQLLATGIEIDSEETTQGETAGFTALHMAAYYGLYSGIPKLLAAGARIDRPVGHMNKEFSGMTALQLAIIRNLKEAVSVLLQNQKTFDLMPYDSLFSISRCFNLLVGSICSKFSKEFESEYKSQLIKIAQKEVLDMARILVAAKFKFDEETKSYVSRVLNINLDTLQIF